MAGALLLLCSLLPSPAFPWPGDYRYPWPEPDWWASGCCSLRLDGGDWGKYKKDLMRCHQYWMRRGDVPEPDGTNHCWHDKIQVVKSRFLNIPIKYSNGTLMDNCEIRCMQIRPNAPFCLDFTTAVTYCYGVSSPHSFHGCTALFVGSCSCRPVIPGYLLI
jgi:hypothetical protein